MLTDEQARERAEEWINGSLPADQERDVFVRAFDGGWVVWSRARKRENETVGDAYGIIDADDGSISLWPPLQIEDVIRQYQAGKSQAGRFPAPVQEALEDGGWSFGRERHPLDVDMWVQQVSEAAETTYETFDAAISALIEFSGLWVEPPDLPSFSLGQDPDAIDYAACNRLAERLGRRVMPLGDHHDKEQPGAIVIQQSGQVYLARGGSAIELGADLDAALVRLCTGIDPDLPVA